MPIDAQEFGELVATVKAIKESTDKIPDLAIQVAVHETKITNMEPAVGRHEKSMQRSIGASAVFSFIGTLIAYAIGSR